MTRESLDELFNSWKEYQRIVVTGPQRSGTRIAAKMIAKSIGWPFKDEETIALRKGHKLHDNTYFKWLNNPDSINTVLQCPRISHACHQTPKPTLVVFMIRDVDEIIASDKHRISKYKQTAWAGPHRAGTPVQSVFTAKARQYSKLFYNSEVLDKWDVPKAVYDVWNTVQKKHDFNYYELDYKLLESHRLWVPLDVRRSKFRKGTQTSL